MSFALMRGKDFGKNDSRDDAPGNGRPLGNVDVHSRADGQRRVLALGHGKTPWGLRSIVADRDGHDAAVAIEQVRERDSGRLEAFGLALERLIPATKIWRRMYDSETQLATDALNFMKSEVERRA